MSICRPDPLRVLVVDDEHVIADSLAMILRACGYSVRAAYSAEQAISIAEPFEPHAVISDVSMPGMSGIDLANWLAERQPRCKVLLMSGNHGVLATPRPKGECSDAPSVLPKPLHPAQILEFVAACARSPEPLPSRDRIDIETNT